MKMTLEHYTQLEHAIGRLLQLANPDQTDFDARAMRSRWDLLHASKFDLRPLYAYLNDDHIDTALRRIVRRGVRQIRGAQ